MKHCRERWRKITCAAAFVVQFFALYNHIRYKWIQMAEICRYMYNNTRLRQQTATANCKIYISCDYANLEPLINDNDNVKRKNALPLLVLPLEQSS